VGRIHELEGLRSLSVWWVVAAHLALATGMHVPWVFEANHAIDLFILLSGFTAFQLLDRKEDSWGSYVLRRGFRLFPVYLAALAVLALTLGLQAAAVLGSPFAESEWAVAQVENIAAARAQFWPNVLSHLALAQGLVPPALVPQGEFAFLPQGWWISLEWQFCLIAPLLYAAIVGRRWVVLGLVAVAVLLLQERAGSAFLPDHLWLFGVGIVTYFFLSRDRLRWLMPGLLAAIIVTAVAVLKPAMVIWFGVLGALYAPRKPGMSLVKGVLAHPGLLQLSRMAYSTFVLHTVAIFALMLVFNALELTPSQYRSMFIPLAAGLTLLLSYAGYRWIEVPGLRLGARLAARDGRPSLSRQPG